MNRDTFTEAVVKAATEIVGVEISPDGRRLPFDAKEENNEFACALLTAIPEQGLYDKNVFWTDISGHIEFAPWLYRLAFKPAVTIYANYFDRVNQSSNIKFPIDQFMNKVRKIKLRGYQRDCRKRARQPCGAPPKRS